MLLLKNHVHLRSVLSMKPQTMALTFFVEKMFSNCRAHETCTCWALLRELSRNVHIFGIKGLETRNMKHHLRLKKPLERSKLNRAKLLKKSLHIMTCSRSRHHRQTYSQLKTKNMDSDNSNIKVMQIYRANGGQIEGLQKILTEKLNENYELFFDNDVLSSGNYLKRSK